MVTKDELHYERARTAAQLAAENPTLDREFCFESDTDHFKRGPGAWNSLPYADATSLPELAVSDPAKVPVATAAGVTTLDVTNLAYKPLVARRTSDLIRSANTTLTNDDVLFLPVETNQVYRMDLYLIYTSGSTPKFKLGWTGPTGATLFWTSNALTTTVTTGTAGSIIKEGLSITASAHAIAGVGITGTDDRIAAPHGILLTSSTAGNLTFQWAQSVSDATNTSVLTGSTLILQRIS